MDAFEKKLTRLDVGLGVLGAITGVLSLPFEEALVPAAILLGAFLLLALMILVHRRARRDYVIEGYAATMAEATRLVESAKHCIWTVRTHVGDKQVEFDYFHALAKRVASGASTVRDVRRIIRFDKKDAEKLREHLHWLIDQFADQDSVRIHWYAGQGPAFDLVIFDEKVALIGLPQIETEGKSGCIVVRDPVGVQGVVHAFQALWIESEELFSGKTSNVQKKGEMKAALDDQLAPFLVPQNPLHLPKDFKLERRSELDRVPPSDPDPE